MANPKEIRTIIGIIGTVFSSSISLSQMPRIIQIYKKKSVEDNSLGHHLLMLLQCFFWVWYGLPSVHKDSILVTVSNGVGLTIEVVYVVVFMIYYSHVDKERKLVCLMLASILFFSTWMYIFISLQVQSSIHLVVGLVCDFWIIFCIVLRTMLGENFSECMSVGLSLVSLVNAGIWTAYSLIYVFDIYLLIGNGAVALFYACQLIVNACRYNKSLSGVVDIDSQSQNHV